MKDGYTNILREYTTIKPGLEAGKSAPKKAKGVPSARKFMIAFVGFSWCRVYGLPGISPNYLGEVLLFTTEYDIYIKHPDLTEKEVILYEDRKLVAKKSL